MYHLLPDRFETVDKLGAGASSQVFLAREHERERLVVVKLFVVPFEGDEARQRFERRCALLARLEHRAIVRLLDWGVMGALPYLVFAYHEGRTLDTLPLDGARASGEWGLHLGARLADGLASAHDAGVLHGNVKPANVLIAEEDQPMLLHFCLAESGLSNIVDSRTGALLSNPRYMAPELMFDHKASPAADLFSLGLLLFGLLSHQSPFSDNPLEAFNQKTLGMGRELAAVAPQVDGKLAAIVDGLLKPLSQRTPDTAAELSRLLRDLGGGQTS